MPSSTGVLPTACLMTHDPLTTEGISLNMHDLRCSASLSSPAKNLQHHAHSDEISQHAEQAQTALNDMKLRTKHYTAQAKHASPTTTSVRNIVERPNGHNSFLQMLQILYWTFKQHSHCTFLALHRNTLETILQRHVRQRTWQDTNRKVT